MKHTSVHFSRIVLLVIIAISFSTTAVCQDNRRKVITRVADLLDTLARRRVDTTYIEVPKQPWRVMSTTNINELSFAIESSFGSESFDEEDGVDALKFKSDVNSGVRMSTGFRLGYRALNLGFAYVFGKHGGTHFTIGTNGKRFGLNISLHRFKSYKSEITAVIHDSEDHNKYKEKSVTELDEPCTISSLAISGYYVFNHRRFSNGATHAMGFIQRRSAGSFIADFSWIRATADYADIDNLAFIILFHDVGRIKMRQINLGFGYSYNWVPCRGLVINASITPRLSLDTRISSWIYSINQSGDELVFDRLEKKHSRFKLTGKARMAVVYNNKRWFFGATGEMQQFRYKHDRTNGKLSDWLVKAVIGYRF